MKVVMVCNVLICIDDSFQLKSENCNENPKTILDQTEVISFQSNIYSEIQIAYHESFSPHCVAVQWEICCCHRFFSCSVAVTWRRDLHGECLTFKWSNQILGSPALGSDRKRFLWQHAHLCNESCRSFFSLVSIADSFWKNQCVFKGLLLLAHTGGWWWSNVSLSTKGPMISLRSTRKRSDYISSRSVISD